MDAMTDPSSSLTAGIEDLYRREGARLWRSVLIFSGDTDITNDAVAEAFAQLIRRGGDVRDPARWVWTAAFAIARGELKRARTLLPLEERPVWDPIATDLADALAQLTPSQRACIVLHYVEGLRLREIANVMGISKSTVGVHLTRARRRLSRELEEADDA
ncbi:MAG TPA: sigma-70 family RNA polymerase sigma factor [Actinomycetota bacterium]